MALPSPNGYDELIRVGRMLKDQIVPDANTANQAQLEAFVTQHAALLGAVRTALDHPSQVRVDYAPLTSSGLNDVEEIVQVMKAVSAQAKLAAVTGRFDDSLVANSNRVQLGEAAGHGGLLVHWLIGNAIQGSGLEGLSRIRDSLSPEQCRELITTLQSVENAAEPVADVVARDAVWEQHSEGWLPRVAASAHPGVVA